MCGRLMIIITKNIFELTTYCCIVGKINTYVKDQRSMCIKVYIKKVDRCIWIVIKFVYIACLSGTSLNLLKIYLYSTLVLRKMQLSSWFASCSIHWWFKISYISIQVCWRNYNRSRSKLWQRIPTNTSPTVIKKSNFNQNVGKKKVKNILKINIILWSIMYYWLYL